MNPLNIVQTCFSVSWGGLEIQALEISRQLRLRGHVVWLACVGRSRLEEAARDEGIRTVPLKVRGYVHPVAVARLTRLIRHERIDVVHCQHSKDIATLVPARLLSGRRCPIILSKRVGSYISKKDLFHQFTYSHVDRVLAISDVIHRNVIDTTPVSPERVITLHDAVDTEHFSPARVGATGVRKEFGFDGKTLVVGFVGRFSPGKGHEEFLEAAARLTQRHTTMRFLVAGEASHGEQAYEQHIRSKATALALDEVLTFTGYRRDVPELMAAFDIFAFPSHAEAFGVVLIEAMAMERPVVSTNCDGVVDIVVDGETGIYVNPKDAGQLADAIDRLARDPALRVRMGKAGRARVEELFSQRRQIDRLEGLYRELLR